MHIDEDKMSKYKQIGEGIFAAAFILMLIVCYFGCTLVLLTMPWKNKIEQTMHRKSNYRSLVSTLILLL